MREEVPEPVHQLRFAARLGQGRAADQLAGVEVERGLPARQRERPDPRRGEAAAEAGQRLQPLAHLFAQQLERGALAFGWGVETSAQPMCIWAASSASSSSRNAASRGLSCVAAWAHPRRGGRVRHPYLAAAIGGFPRPALGVAGLDLASSGTAIGASLAAISSSSSRSR